MSWGRLPENPFVGLRPFESHESLLFFGRHAQTVELLEQLHATRFLAVVGSSGSGKSSLVRAGLIPKLKAGFLVEDRDAWRFAIFKPGDSPLAHLAAALDGALDGAGGGLSGDELRERGVVAALESAGPALAAAGANLFVLVDQFEELFRFGLHTAGGARGEEAAHFVAILLELARQRETPIYVAMTMRSDFLGDCDAFLGLPEAMNRSQYLVPRLTRRQRREAIEAPIKLYRAAIAPRLVDRLLNETIDARDDLPVLQHALMRTWSAWKRDGAGAIDVEHYEAAGTIERALSDHAEEAMAGMDTAERGLTRRIFQALTETDPGNRRIRRPARLSAVEAITGASRAQVRAIIDRFRSDGRSFLVVSSEDSDRDAAVDISHESLIRQWQRLRDWVDEEAESARVYRRLAETARLRAENKAELYRGAALALAERWLEEQQPSAAWAGRYDPDLEPALEFLQASRTEADRKARAAEEARRRELRRTRIVAAVLALAFLITLGLGYYALIEKRNADRAAIDALEAQDNAQLAQGQAEAAEEAARLEAERSAQLRNLAESERQRAETERNRAEQQAALAMAQEREAVRARAEAESQRRQAQARFLESKAGQALEESGASLLLSALLATESLAAADTPEGREALERVLPLLPQALTIVRGTDTTATALSPDGERVTSVELVDPERSDESEHAVVVRSRRTGSELGRLHLNHPVDQLVYAPDGRLLVASGGRGTTVLAVDPTTRLLAEVHRFESDSASERNPRVAFSPDGTLLAAASYEHILVFRTDSWEERRFRVPGGALIPYFDPEGRLLFSANAASTTVVDLVREAAEPVQLMETPRPTALAVSGDGQSMAVSTYDGFYVGEPDWQAWRTRVVGPLHAGPPHQLTGRPLHESRAVRLAFGPGGELFSVDNFDHTARLWAIDDGVYRELLRFPGVWQSGDLSHDGRWAITSSSGDIRAGRVFLDAATVLWDAAYLDDAVEQRPFGSSRRDRHWSQHEWGWTPGGAFVLVDSGGLSVFDPATWNVVASVPFACGEPQLSFGPAGRLLLARCARGLQVVATSTWQRLAELDVAGATAVRFSPGERLLAAIREQPEAINLKVFETEGWQSLAQLELVPPDTLEPREPPHRLELGELRWRPDRRQLAIDSLASKRESWSRRSVNPKTATAVRETLVWDLGSDTRAAWRRQTERTEWDAPSSGAEEPSSETTRSEQRDGDADLLVAAESWPASPPDTKKWEPEELSVSTRAGVIRVRSERLDDLIDEACSRLPTDFTPQQAAEYLGDERAPGTCAGRATAHRTRGRDLARLGYLPAAETAFRRALELDPALGLDPARELALFAAQGALEEGRALAQAGQLEAGLARLHQALELNPALIMDPEAELRRFAAPAEHP